MVDEDGIWRDDADDGHFSLRTYHTDSGVGGGGDRKSLSSIHQLHGGALSPPNLSPRDDFDDRFDIVGDFNADGSFVLDDKSINISELEASESGQGDEYSPFDGRSDVYDSNGLDLPELVDDSYQNMTTSERSAADSRKDSKATSILTDDPFDDDADQVARGGHSDDSDISDMEDGAGSAPVPYSSASIEYLLGSGATSPVRRATPHSEVDDELRELPVSSRVERPPPVTGDSIFTQDDPPQIGNRHSLIEFERLEAAVEDEQDLIGAYLKVSGH